MTPVLDCESEEFSEYALPFIESANWSRGATLKLSASYTSAHPWDEHGGRPTGRLLCATLPYKGYPRVKKPC